MITEDYVNVETAKLLKEKGFDETVRCFYNIQTEILCDDYVKTKNSYTENIAAPTIQMTIKWLREIHNLYITVFHYNSIYGRYPYNRIQYYWIIETIKDDTRENRQIKSASIKKYTYQKYEEACEDAIKYCLEHLI